ncbi:hypothetical protein RB195_001900 [Necator americanus]|uniref:RRM domain-containing protein n=1 Tax=Necator americanus TaxID=51031 RepID=A0ABR1DGZ5_NECAM
MDCKVYVGGLPNDATSQEIEDAFYRFGRIRKVWVARRPPGFAFVEFEDSRDAEDAVKALDGSRICGVRARVEMSHGRGRGSGGGGGGYGGRRSSGLHSSVHRYPSHPSLPFTTAARCSKPRPSLLFSPPIDMQFAQHNTAASVRELVDSTSLHINSATLQIVTNTDLDRLVATVDDLAAVTAEAAHVRGAPFIEAVRLRMEIVVRAVDLVRLLRETTFSLFVSLLHRFCVYEPVTLFGT